MHRKPIGRHRAWPKNRSRAIVTAALVWGCLSGSLMGTLSLGGVR